MVSAQIIPPPEQLAGKVALVTGAASGIGAATAMVLAKAGAAVAAADINEAGAKHVADGIRAQGGQAVACQLDVTVTTDWESAVNSVLKLWGRFDILVNNAGIAAAGPLENMTLTEWRQLMSVNLDGVMLGIRHAMRPMQSSGGGSIVNIASAAGIKALPNNSAYGTSKAAVRFLTRVAALEGAPHRIRVNSISPGAVATPIWEGTPMWPTEAAAAEGRGGAMRALVAQGFAEPTDVARVVLFLAGDESKFINGADLPVDSGFSAG